MIKGVHYKHPDFVDELLGRYNNPELSAIFDSVNTLLIGNNLLIAKDDAVGFINKLYSNGYIITMTFLYRVSNNEVEHTQGVEPNYENDTEYFYPTKEMVLSLFDTDVGFEWNYIEIIAGTVKESF